MKITYDKEADSIYILLAKKRTKIKKCVPLEDTKTAHMIVHDFDKNEKLIGIEICGVKGTLNLENLKKLEFKEL